MTAAAQHGGALARATASATSTRQVPRAASAAAAARKPQRGSAAAARLGQRVEEVCLDESGPNYANVGRNLALELVRVTEAGALSSARWLGKGDKVAADQAAVDSMRAVLKTISFDGRIVIGEGEKDEAPMLYRGERLGSGAEPRMDIAVDPLDGTTLTAMGRGGAISVIACAEQGALFDPGPAFYMEKIAVGPAAADAVDITRSIEDNLAAVAEAVGKRVEDLVVILDRPRHAELVKQVRRVGACIHMISDGDVAAAVATAAPGHGNVDVLLGIGGTPEGVIAAAALRCLGGEIQGRLWPRHDEDRAAFEAAGYDPRRVLTTRDLCGGREVLFAATGVSDGDLVDGIRFTPTGATSSSIVMRAASGTVRQIVTHHRWRSAPGTCGPPPATAR